MSRLARLLLSPILLLGANALLAASEVAAPPQGSELKIERVTPLGEDVPPGNQIAIEFNRPVVPLGRMERAAHELPIEISPALTCHWRWSNTRTLTCNLNDSDALRPSTQYLLRVGPGLRALDGGTLPQPVSFRFNTRRAQVQGVDFRPWRGPAQPSLRVYWDQPVAKTSVLRHLYLRDSGQRRIPLRVSPDQERRALPPVLPLPGEKLALVTDEEEQESDDGYQLIDGEEYRRVWLLEPAAELPSGQTIGLYVEPGLKPAQGDLEGNESRLLQDFDTFPPPAFVGVRCTDNQDRPVLIAPGALQAKEGYCNPLKSVSLEFSAPVARRMVKEFASFDPPLGPKVPDPAKPDPWGDLSEETDQVYGYHSKGSNYGVNLPYGLKAAKGYRVRVGQSAGGAETIRDKFGRALVAPAQVAFHTDHRLPNFVMEYQAAVLEQGVDSEVPLYVNNLDWVGWGFNRLTLKGPAKNQSYEVNLPKVVDIQYAIPMGLRKMLGGKSGALWGQLQSDPEIPNQYANREVFAQVTPYQVHLKLGHFNTLVWVTDLATGQPVADAEVIVYQDLLTELNGPSGKQRPARTDAQGLALLPGTDQLDPTLEISRGWEQSAPRLFVRVSKGQQMALLPVWHVFEIDSYRATGTSFYPTNQTRYGHMRAWGTTAQGIYHPGDQIQYKLYLRNQDNNSLTPPPPGRYWLEVLDPTGKVAHQVKEIRLSEFGGFAGEFSLGKQAAVGWYDFQLKASFGQSSQPPCPTDTPAASGEGEAAPAEGEGVQSCDPAEFTWNPMRVLVSDFTPAPFKVDNHLNGDLFRPGEGVTVETSARLHSGGPYTQAQARVTANLTPSDFHSRHPAAAGFSFGVALEDTPEAKQLHQTSGALDDQGELKTQFTLNAPGIFHGQLSVESAVQDDRGKQVAHQTQAGYLGVDRLVGVRLSEWFYQAKQDVAAQYLVVDERGNPVSGVPVTLALERKERVGARVKGSGNAYVPATETTVVREAECQGVSEAGAATCLLRPERAGDYTLKASLTDTQGRAQVTETQLWVSGRDYVLWDEGSDSALDLVPDKQDYKVGDTARILVKNPYPGAQALVTVERYGVLDRFVRPLEGSAAVIELPIKPDYLPGCYVSVVISSPRVESPLVPVGQVDLGKPSFRMGYTKLEVKDAYKEIEVKASADKEVYRPGDRVRVSLQAQARHPRADRAEPIELAVAVLDEAVFDLIAKGKDYYDPHAGFFHLEDLDLRNYSLLTRLIGRQKFEKKGANPGGDGGVSLEMRSVFKFVSYWNPELRTDAQGRAEVEFQVPDNLTGWRILALAVTPSDRFGLGQANFKVNRPTEVRPEMPNQVSEGDRFEARFSVMNRTQQERTLNLRIQAEGDLDPAQPAQLEQSLTLKPFARALVALPVKASTLEAARERDQGTIRFRVQAGDASDQDALTHQLPVRKQRSLEVAANYGTTQQAQASETIAFPQDIYPDRGGLSLTLAPTVLGNLEGAFRYLRGYPYSCWEQLLTRAVMAANYQELRGYLPARLEWPDAAKLPAQTLERAAEFQAPNGGMAYFVASDERADPYLSAYTALAFNWLRLRGHAVPEAVEAKLHQYLQNLLRRDATPGYYSAGMAATVRAVALAALAETKKADLADLQRYAPHRPRMSLFGKTHFALAAGRIEGGEALALETAQAILAQGNETGGKFVFNEVIDDGYSRMLHSPLRENCAILDLFSLLGESGAAAQLVGDIPFRLVRAITQSRGSRDHWENTQENVFCMNALADYSRVYEKERPVFKVGAALDQVPFGTATFKDFRDPQVTLERPITAADPGRSAQLEINRQGKGRLYYSALLSYAPRAGATSDSNNGIEIHREYSIQRDGKWQLLPKPYAVRQGDLVRVDLYVSVPAARNFVVVDDPIPGGFEPLNTDLATTSMVDADQGRFQAAGGSLWFKYGDWSEYGFSFWNFYHKELLHHAARFYADYLPPGNYHLSYMAQAIGAGDYTVLPARAEEMYDPDVYGKTSAESLRVESNLEPGR